MSWSRAEVAALAARAARGAGAPPAQATRFGQAAALHLGQGRGAAALQAALDALPGGPILDLALQVQEVAAALRRGETSVVLAVSCEADLLQSYLDTLPFTAHWVATGETGAEVALAAGADAPALTRISGCEALISRMTVLADRTFVPESAASRRGGAGAGLSDND